MPGDGNDLADSPPSDEELDTDRAVVAPRPTDIRSSIAFAEPKNPSLPHNPAPQGTRTKLRDFFRPTGKPRDSYSDWDIQEISRLLIESGRPAWAQVPRLYTILRHIGQLQVLDAILDEGISDIWFPFTLSSSPTILSSSLQSQFLESQPLVLTKAVDLEKGVDKKHAHFGRDELFPFQIRGKLGGGGYATVNRIFSTFSGREFARKRFRRDKRHSSKGEIQSFLTELQVLKRTRHHHCVELIASYTDPKYFGLIMSPVADCNMAQFYRLIEEDSEKSALLRGFYGCLANGLGYLHDAKIRHRDIKPENILVKGNNVYLTDFGIPLDWKALTRSTTTDDSAKSWVYCSPEVANCKKRNSSSDIWSLGCVFLEMSTVLKGRRINAMRMFYKERTESYRFYQNIPAIREWCRALRKSGSTSDNSTLDWALSMLQIEPERRPLANNLYARIADGEKKSTTGVLRFLGDCCFRDRDDTSASESAFDDGSAWAEDKNDGNASSSVTETSLQPLVVQEKQVVVDNSKVQQVAEGDRIGVQITAMQKHPVPVGQTDAFADPMASPQSPPENTRSLSTETIKNTDFTHIAQGDEAVPSTDAVEWPIINLDGVLPLLGPFSWKSPSALLTSVRSDERFMGYLKSNAANCHELLLAATTEDIVKLVHMLLRGGLKADDPEIDGGPLLHVLFWGKCSDVVFQAIVESGAPLDVEDHERRTPLFAACAYGNSASLKVLLALGADVNSICDTKRTGPQSLLFIAAKYGRLDTVKVLLDRGAELAPKTVHQNVNPLYAASGHGHKNVVQFLLENHAAEIDVNALTSKYTSLYQASRNGYATIVKILLANGAWSNQAVTYKGIQWKPIHIASKYGHTEIVQLLVASGASILNTTGGNGVCAGFIHLHRWEAGQIYEVIKIPRTAERVISERSGSGWMPIHLASQNGHVEVVRLLVAFGADITEREWSNGLDSLHLASEGGHIEVVKFFLDECGAEGDVSRRSCSGWMPLHFASRYGHTALVQLLLDHGANLDAISNPTDGWTAYHLATKHGHAETVEVLLAHSADISTRGGHA